MLQGGVERVTLNLIAQFVRNGVDCRLALRRCHGELMGEACALVPVEELAPRGMHQFVPALARLLRRWRPTHVVTAFTDIAALTWLAMRFAHSRARWVHGAHNTHAAVVSRPGALGAARFRLDTRLADFVYRRADAIVAVSEGVRSEILTQFGIPCERVITIYNPVIPESELRPTREPRHPVDEPWRIVAIGRLTRQKGFDLLVRAMASVPPPWQLDIWGEGPERDLLERLIASLGLAPMIHLRGYTARPFDVLRDSDLFVLPSRYEGLGNTLIEALACQCQIVASDCQHGPSEILQGGRLGRLVPVEDIAALAAAIRDFTTDESRFDPQALLARAADFGIHTANLRWRAVLNDTGSNQFKAAATKPG